MRHRSPTNSRKWENIQIRRDYQFENPWCELAKQWPKIFRDPDAHDPHHIVGGSGGRVDHPSNLLAVSRSAHCWIDDNPADAKVLCIWIKVRKGEFEPDVFRRASGMRVAGWLEIAAGKIRNEWIEPIRLELITHFERLGDVERH